MYYALKSKHPVKCIFIFDSTILDKLEHKDDARVTFIHDCVRKLKEQLIQLGSDLHIFSGTPEQVFEKLFASENISEVYANRDYEPEATKRDNVIVSLAGRHEAKFNLVKDQVIFDRDEVLKPDGDPYVVYTPYSRTWKEKLNPFFYKSYPTEDYFSNLHQYKAPGLPQLNEIGFERSNIDVPDYNLSEDLLNSYQETRDVPSVRGTSRLSPHLRFGTISIRQAVQKALHHPKFLNELIWRDFYQMILFHFPHSATDAFKPKYDRIEWETNEEHFHLWCEGKTGYPMVDAGMRELNQTGFMHNRVRMIAAGFLTKHLLLDWRWGEAYFAAKLLDYDMASNVGGWQWAAGSGCDAAPYFRVFNPTTQLEKFDPNREYVRRWIPEIDSDDYPKPIVDHKSARERAIERYKEALS